MAVCVLCEKKFQDRRGLHGHFRFVHGIEYGSGRPAKKTALTEATKRVIERKREEKELIERIKGGEFGLIPRSKIGQKSEVRGGQYKGLGEALKRQRDATYFEQKRGGQFKGLREALKRQQNAPRFEGLKEGLKKWM